jgi:hypothetical protein
MTLRRLDPQQGTPHVQRNRPGFQAGGPAASTPRNKSTGLKIGCWTHGEPHYQCNFSVERERADGSIGPTIVEDLGKAHIIHATVINHQAEHQFIVLETSSIIANQTFGFR